MTDTVERIEICVGYDVIFFKVAYKSTFTICRAKGSRLPKHMKIMTCKGKNIGARRYFKKRQRVYILNWLQRIRLEKWWLFENARI